MDLSQACVHVPALIEQEQGATGRQIFEVILEVNRRVIARLKE